MKEMKQYTLHDCIQEKLLIRFGNKLYCLYYTRESKHFNYYSIGLTPLAKLLKVDRNSYGTKTNCLQGKGSF
jgi:hypothetical protein